MVMLLWLCAIVFVVMALLIAVFTAGLSHWQPSGTYRKPPPASKRRPR